MNLKPAICGKIFALFVSIAVIITSCQLQKSNVETASDSITADDFKNYISVIASDSFMGRAPATVGEEKAIHYLADQFKAFGLEPANKGSYFQEVPLVKITAKPGMAMHISGGKQNFNLIYSDDFMGNTSQLMESVQIQNSDIIFIGYGIDSPENDWNDYEGLDLKGKTVLMMVNDPGYATADSTLFNGKAMTYFGRWTYKFEEAARRGATAAIIIHETGAASYPWGVVKNSWSGAHFQLAGDEISKSSLLFQGWITNDIAKKIFESAGLDYNQLTSAAARRGFKPVEMKLKASINFNNKIENIKSNNVAALWPGKDRPDEIIIYSAHWDHFGLNNTYKDDSILNGAVDNGTGTTALLQIAKAFTQLHDQQNRSILFLAVTCEEQGLLGSQYYAENPLFPLNKTVADINMDALNIFGKTKDMTIVGYGNSELDRFAEAVLIRHGRYAVPDPHPERGGYFRSDHFSFAKVGVPSLYLSDGSDDVEHGREWAQKVKDKWIMENYHKPSDNYEPEKWNFDGLTDDIRIFFETGYDLSISNDFPNWNPGSPYKALRDSMMRQ